LPVINDLCLLGSQFEPALGACVYRLATPRQFWPVTLLIVIVSTIVAHNISRTRLGRAFVSIRDNDLAAELMGVNLFAYKLRAFFLAAVYAGAAGALLAHNLRRIDAATLGLVDSIWFLGMLVVGGMGSSLGPILGAALITLLEELATVLAPALTVWFPGIAGGAAAALRPLLFGLALMLFLIFEPRGLAYRWTLLKAAWRLRPFSN
jgi:branched-chain amino acid transport system permease protein